MENDPDMDKLFELIEGWRPTVPEWKEVQTFLNELKQTARRSALLALNGEKLKEATRDYNANRKE